MNNFSEIIHSSYNELNVYEADIIYIYSDLRYFSKFLKEEKSKSDFCAKIVSPLLEKNKTIVMTTFTYTTEGVFDLYKTFTKLGVMNKWILMQEGVVRSEHPLFSYAALGNRKDIVKNIGKSAFGYESIYDRLKGSNAAFLHFGRPVTMGNTIIHHIEQLCGSTYRVNKAFKTKVYNDDRYIGTDYTASLRRRDVMGKNFNHTFKVAAKKMVEKKIIRQVGSENIFNNISFYKYDETLEFLVKCFYDDPMIFLQKEFIQY